MSPPPRRALGQLDPERVRYRLERELVAQLASAPEFDALVADLGREADGARVRRELLARSLRLSVGMAPEAHAALAESARVLGITREVELYQSAGRENPAMHLVAEPILVEVQGRLLTQLDAVGLVAVFGHELGHFVAHGPSGEQGKRHVAASILARRGSPGSGGHMAERAASLLTVAGEITADRFALLACQDLSGMLRAQMSVTTGLPVTALTWDTDAYLRECEALMEACLAGHDEARHDTHPEHHLRAYAAWLFSESDLYRALTGQGSGARKLADVEAVLDRILRRPELDPHFDPLDAPPLEVFECALAGAVIMARADGELAAEESELIERIFAPSVPGWQEYLEAEVARERLARTAPIVRAGGPDLARRCFLLLAHMLGPDGTIDEREVSALLGVGVVLGHAELFERWAVAALAALGADIVVTRVPALVIPLPARHDDVLEALDAFLDGVCRRGSGSIALRRLLRLMGQPELGEGAARAIEGALAARRVTMTPPLRRAGLHDTLHLVASEAAPTRGGAPAPAPEALDPSRQHLIRGLSRLRDQLISGDGRSPSVRLRVLRNERGFDLGRLERVSLGMGERALEQVRAGRVARLVDASEAGTHRAAEECGEALQALDRAHRDRVEETGSHDLYLGYPFLTGAVAKQSGVVAYPVRAPLLLFPVELVRDGRGARSFKLAPRNDEDPIVNQALLRLVFNKMRFGFPDALAEELDGLAAERVGGLDALLARLRELGVEVARTPRPLGTFEPREDLDQGGHRLELEELAVLGLFPQSSSDLLQDYDALITQLGDASTDVSALLAAASVLLPAELRGERSGPPAQQAAHPLIAADPTQRQVLAECLQHEATVIDGPPGTGKSQVIANLVLDALRRGERVAVVCEKRAALDVVFQRIEALGLAHAMALVHDVHEDRKAVYAQIAARLEGFAPQPVDQAAAERLVDEHAAVCRELDARRALLGQRCAGTQLRTGELLTLASATAPRGEACALRGLEDVTEDALTDVLALTAELHADQAYWAPGTAWRGEAGQPARASLADHDDHQVMALVRRVDAAVEAAARFDQACAGHPRDAAALDAAAELLEREETVRRARASLDEGDALYVGARRLALSDEVLADFREADAALELERAALAEWDEPVHMEVAPDLVAALSVLESYAGRFVRFFVWAWWMARLLVRRRIAAAWPERAGHPFEPAFVQLLIRRVRAARVWSAATKAMRHLGGAYALRHRRDLESLLPAAAQMVLQQHRLRRAPNALASLGLPIELDAAQLREWDRLVSARRTALERLRELRDALAHVSPYAPGLGDAPTRGALSALRERLAREGSAVARADGRLARGRVRFAGLPAILDALVSALPGAGPESWQQAVVHAWATAQLARVARELPALDHYGTAASDEQLRSAATRLAALEERLSALGVQQVRAALDAAPLLNVSAPEKHKRRTPEQAVWEGLLKETRKKRSLLALRTFVRQFAEGGLLDVVPVWLLSPETMAILFPREPLFDLVVFDEASQCTVESGLPVLLRAKRVVVAGDEQQMPPTSFFRMGSGSEEADERDDDDERAARDMLSAESLLTLTRSRVRHTGLAWHYRCQHESLIAFSNHAMYGGDLLTIPSTQAAQGTPALRWVEVTDGVYDGNANVVEAERVVALIAELLAEPRPPTIGVVSFNLKQRAAVLDAIERRSASDALFSEAWARAEAAERLDERPFVKNLEAVQGDERDVILFTLAHAPVTRRRRSGAEERYVPARFGPLGLRGGERRLNVAISRAKQRCYVVSSFSPELLSVAGTSHAGPQLFKRYLEYAKRVSEGHVAQAEGILDRVRETRRPVRRGPSALPIAGYVPIATQLGLALERAGVPHELGVGTSDFRIPVAVVDPDDPTRFRLAILIDETGEAASAYDRFVHRPAVLRARGWDVMLLDAATWSRRPEAVVHEIRERVSSRGLLTNG